MEQSVEQKKRYELIDTLRGFAVLNMIVYHAIWDFNSFFDVEWTWYDDTAGFVWQQFICWSFILISGFCFLFSSHPYRRGAVIFACGAVVSIATFVILPSAKIEFGILTFLGCAILLTAVLRPFLQKNTACNGADIIDYLICTHQEHQRWISGVCVVAAGADSGMVLSGARNDLPGLYSAGFFLPRTIFPYFLGIFYFYANSSSICFAKTRL